MAISYAQDGYEKKIKKLKKEIIRKVDRFDDSVTYWSTARHRSLTWCKAFNKDMNGAIFLSFSTYGGTLSVGEKGVYVVFEDGTKWSKDCEIDADAGVGSGWRYTAFVSLDYNDVELFASKKIEAFKLYIYEEDLLKKVAEEIMILAKIFKDITKEAEH